jgi:hypothetical protein
VSSSACRSPQARRRRSTRSRGRPFSSQSGTRDASPAREHTRPGAVIESPHGRTPLATTSMTTTSTSASSPPQHTAAGCRFGERHPQRRSQSRTQPSRSDASTFVAGEMRPRRSAPVRRARAAGIGLASEGLGCRKRLLWWKSGPETSDEPDVNIAAVVGGVDGIDAHASVVVEPL